MSKLITLAIAALISVSSLAIAEEQKQETAPAAGAVTEQKHEGAKDGEKAQEAKKAKKEKKSKKQ